MTTTIEYEAYIHNDFPADQIDQQGYARLRDKARDQGLQLVGEATRISDEPAVAITVQTHDGREVAMCVPADDPRAEGKASDTRLIRWSIAAKPVETTDPVKVPATVLAEGMLARAELPPEITEAGGLVEMKHGLGGEVTVLAFNANGEPVGYAYGVPIDDDTHELVLPPGAARLEATRDPDEDENEEGPQ